MIKYICPQLLFAGFVLSLYYTFSHLKKSDLKNKENLSFSVYSAPFGVLASMAFLFRLSPIKPIPGVQLV